MSEAPSLPGSEPIHPRPATPVEPSPEKPGSELRKRLLTASILVPLVTFMIIQGGLAFLGMVVVVVLLGQREFYGLIEEKGAHPLVGFGLAAGAALPVVAYLGNEYHTNLLMTATLLAVMFLQLGKAQIGEALASISGTFFGVFYVGWLLSHGIVLRNFHDAMVSRWGGDAVARLGIAQESGIFLLFYVLTVLILCDAGAYFGGRAYGKRKLAPSISPKKSVEGAICGVLTGVLAGFAAKGIIDIFWPQLSAFLSWNAVFVFGALVSLVGIVGDLVESLLKRDAATKDAGQLLPGMGGILDRIDSTLLGVPVMYYLMLFYVFLTVG